MAAAVLVPMNGNLVAVRTAKGAVVVPGVVTVAGLNDKTSSAEVLVVGYRSNAEVAQQTVQSIGGPEYIFVFGDKLGDISIGIIMYPGSCGTDGNSAQFNTYLKAWQFYTKNRMQPTKTTPVSLSFAGVSFSGLVTGFQSDADANQGYSVIHGNLMLKGWVPPSTVGGP